MMTRLGASRMSSVLGLKARPHNANGSTSQILAESRDDLVNDDLLLAFVGGVHCMKDPES
jgi:hypothetical protein